MKPISFEEHKKIQLEILTYFDDFCEKHQLRYFLSYGSLIGAVRHKGFIPWDDDIDVWMPRPDYDEFIRIFREENTEPAYRINIPGEKEAKHSFIKLFDSRTAKIEDGIKYKNDYLGVDIDIWPLDGQPTDYKEFIKWYKKLKLRYLFFFARISDLSYGSLSRRFKVFVLKCIGGSKTQMIKQTDKLHNLYKYECSEYVGTIISFFDNPNSRYKKEWFDEYIMMDFEDKKFRAPKEYDKILTEQYGDYMTPPPADKQVTHHLMNVFWKE